MSELGPEDSGRNIVEIIFKSSWQKRDRPICHIDRILKVHNAPRTVARFEAYRDAVRSRCRALVGPGRPSRIIRRMCSGFLTRAARATCSIGCPSRM